VPYLRVRYWFWGRPSFCDLWHDLRAATPETRPPAHLAMGYHSSRHYCLRTAPVVASTAGLILARVASWPRGYTVAHDHSCV
jgi:hypothetical protein